jgi:hypothetical protein
MSGGSCELCTVHGLGWPTVPSSSATPVTPCTAPVVNPSWNTQCFLPTHSTPCKPHLLQRVVPLSLQALGLPVCFPLPGIPLGHNQEELVPQPAPFMAIGTPTFLVSPQLLPLAMASTDGVAVSHDMQQQGQQEEGKKQQEEEEGEEEQEQQWMLEEDDLQWADLAGLQDNPCPTPPPAAAAAGADMSSCAELELPCNQQQLPGSAVVITAGSGATPAAAAEDLPAAPAVPDTWPPSRRASLEMDAYQRPAASSCAAADTEPQPPPPTAAAAAGVGGKGAGGCAASTRPWLPPLLPAVPPGSTLDLQDLLEAIPPGVPVNPHLAPVRVNPKQYRCILRRRLQRARAGQEQRRGVVQLPRKVGGAVGGCCAGWR